MRMNDAARVFWSSSLLVAGCTGLAQGQLITGETATASSTLSGNVAFDRQPAYAVNEAGLTGGDSTAVTPDQTHANGLEGQHWLSSGDCCGGVDNDPWFSVDWGRSMMFQRSACSTTMKGIYPPEMLMAPG